MPTRKLLSPFALVGLLPWLTLALGGCNWSPTRPFSQPQSKVTGVELVETGPNGASVNVIVEFTNPTDEQLPLRQARVAVHSDKSGDAVAGLIESFDRIESRPHATVPPNAGTRVVLPTILLAKEGATVSIGDPVRVSGRIIYEPEGSVRGMLTDSGVPLPSVTFSGRTTLQASVPSE